MTQAEAVQKVREEIASLLHEAILSDDTGGFGAIAHIKQSTILRDIAAAIQRSLDLLTAADDPVAALPGKWRREADREEQLNASDGVYVWADKIRSMADELESALGGE